MATALSMNFVFECILDARTGYGQVSVNLLKQFYKLGLQPNVFAIENNIILTPFNPHTKEFIEWLETCLTKAPREFDRSEPAVRYCQLVNAYSRVSTTRNILLTAHELDAATAAEVNIVRQYDLTFFTCEYSADVFRQHPEIAGKVGKIPHGFDADSFMETGIRYQPDVVVFTLVGKLEKRKRQAQVLAAWARKYGNQPGYVLNCALFAPFIAPESRKELLIKALGGKEYSNIRFFPFMPTNKEYNHFLNAGNIVLAMSGAEGFGLPEFQAVALGKYCVGLNATGYREWMTPQNTILVEPNGKEEVYDNVAFFKGQHVNQGNIFTFDDDEFIAACERAVAAYRAQPVNKAGLELQTRFTWEASARAVLDALSG